MLKINLQLFAAPADIILGDGVFSIGASSSTAVALALTRGGGNYSVEREIRLIEAEKILARFPDRTSSDLYIWIIRYWDDLKKKYGNQYSRKKEVMKFSE